MVVGYSTRKDEEDGKENEILDGKCCMHVTLLWAIG